MASRRPQSLTFKPFLIKEVGNKRKIINDQRKRSTLGSGVIRQAVLLPATEVLNGWFAVNTLDFFNDFSLLWGIINPGPELIGTGFPNGIEYHWADSRNQLTPIRCSAVQYIDYVVNWVETLLNDNSLFPDAYDYNFSNGYSPTLKRVYTRLFRCFAIVYSSHYTALEELNATAHINTLFKHFMYFHWEFNIIDEFELEVIHEIVFELKRSFEFDSRGLQSLLVEM